MKRLCGLVEGLFLRHDEGPNELGDHSSAAVILRRRRRVMCVFFI